MNFEKHLEEQSKNADFKKEWEEKIEDEYDLKCYKQAIEEYKEKSNIYLLTDIKKELGL